MKITALFSKTGASVFSKFLLVLFFGSTLIAKEKITVVNGSPSLSPATQSSARTLKRKVAIARFTNETSYGRSFLVDSDLNPIGKQALDILSKKLLDTGKFILLERADMEKINVELGLANLGALKTAADYLVVGSITSFGRKDTGKVGVFSRTKTQTAFAKVTVRLIDVQSGMVIYAEEGSGEAFSEQKTTLGLGLRRKVILILIVNSLSTHQQVVKPLLSNHT